MNHCVVIPVYNHGAPLEATLENLQPFGLPIFVVDDGSADATREAIDELAKRFDIRLIRLPQNTGKGGAVMAGLRAASEAGFSHALQVDADGQHDLDDVPKLLAASSQHPTALIAGSPQFDESAPASRRYGRRLTSFWVAIETLSMKMPDTMCGFRVYPLESTVALIDSRQMGQRMDFDPEIAVRLFWSGVEIVGVPTTVIYPAGGTSSFHVVRDNWLITKLHTRLVLGMLLRLPMLLGGQIRRRRAHWSKVGERGAVWTMQLCFGCYRLLGRGFFSMLLYPIVAYYYMTSTHGRAVSATYLEHIRRRREQLGLPPDTEISTFKHLIQFGHAIMDKVAMWAGKFPAEAIEFDDPVAYREFRERHQGALFIGSHLGNLEVLRAHGATMPDFNVHALVFTRNSEKFMRVLAEASPEALDALIQVDSLGPESVTMLQERLEAGEHVAIVADRTSVRHRERSVYADFLGEPAPFPEGPFVLAHLLGCPVYLLFCLKIGKSYRIFLEKFADSVKLPRAQRKAALRAYAEQFARRLEHYCLLAPMQWFNFFDFWNQAEKVGSRYAARES